jgi:cellulose synthase/poly-beta-1,6-N-acetylglucosamine synthase-like glycosyltransferase
MAALSPDQLVLALCGSILFLALFANASIAALAATLRLRTAAAEPASPPSGAIVPLGSRPFFSIHVPAHDEPAPLLIATIDALAAQNYPDFEIIVIDNNTPEKSTWLPVARHCGSLGPRVRFMHRAGVRGAKAGALNIALDLADLRATHIVVVDADYVVAPGFLQQAAEALEEHGADYIQFPQAYRNGPQARAVTEELGDYFRAHARAANATGSMLLTGTLSVISRKALEKVGGWPVDTITEDADLGLRLFLGGARGVFIDRHVGAGLLPIDLHGLMLQRHRWAAGNVQTLLYGLKRIGPAAGWMSVLTQLLAWPAFGALPALALLFAGLLRIWAEPSAIWLAVEGLAAATLAGGLAAMVVEHAVLKRRPEAVPVRIALWWTASMAWLPVVLGLRPRFRRTPKLGVGQAGLPTMMLVGAPILGGGAILLGATGAPFAAVSLLLPLLSLPLAQQIDSGLRRSHVDVSDREAA